MKNNSFLALGEFMLRFSSEKGKSLSDFSSYQVNLGGAELNVAVVLSNFGINAKVLSKVPDNSIGEGAIREIKKQGVDTSLILKGGERLGTYYLESGVGHKSSEVMYDRAHSSFASLRNEEVNWNTVFEGITWFHWSGITPALSQLAADLCKQAVLEAKKRNITISVDLNYRSKLWKYGVDPKEIMPELVKYCDVVVGNEGHNYLMLGIDPIKSFGYTHPEDYQEVCERVISKFSNVKTVAFTVRETISASHNKLQGILFSQGQFATTKLYNVSDIVDRIGSGDAFMAGLIYGLIKKEQSTKLVDFATACAVLKHYHSGDFFIEKEEKIRSLYSEAGFDVKR